MRNLGITFIFSLVFVITTDAHADWYKKADVQKWLDGIVGTYENFQGSYQDFDSHPTAGTCSHFKFYYAQPDGRPEALNLVVEDLNNQNQEMILGYGYCQKNVGVTWMSKSTIVFSDWYYQQGFDPIMWEPGYPSALRIMTLTIKKDDAGKLKSITAWDPYLLEYRGQFAHGKNGKLDCRATN